MADFTGISEQFELEVPPVDAERELELDSLATANLLHERPPANGSGIWLLISLGAFLLSQAGGFNLPSILLLVAVLALHESGHYIGMLLFGYRDVRMFFIPFFGAAVTGKKHAAPAWQQIIVLLLGPLPGIVLALVLYLILRPEQQTVAYEGIVMLLGLNAFNLLPLLPLDGGRVMHLLIFRRHPVLEVLFRLLAAAGLGGLALLSGLWILGLIAVFTVLGTGFQYQMARQARRLRFALPSLVSDWKLTNDAERREIYQASVAMLPQDRMPKNIATRILLLHEAAVTRSPGIIATLGFFLVYGAGMVVTVGTVFAIAFDHRAAQEKQFVDKMAEMQKLNSRHAERLEEAAQLEAAGKHAQAEELRAAVLAEMTNARQGIDGNEGELRFVPAPQGE